jgi:hypothetical protein
MGLISNTFLIDPKFVSGFPEFVRYWMAVSGLHEPLGDLYANLETPSLDSLTPQGWNHKAYWGYWVLFDVNWYLTPLVQNFVSSIHREGADIERFWTEQCIWTMLKLLLVPVEEFLLVSFLDIQHGRSTNHYKELVKTCVADLVN